MQKFAADKLLRIARYLAIVGTKFENVNRKDEIGESSGSIKQVESIGGTCVEIGLTISAKCANDILKNAKKKSTTFGTMADLFGHLERTILWEMEDKLFMLVPPERAELFNKPELLGQDVLGKFPALQFDIVEAGNCYVLGRGTACVFHLMRVMESGVQEFGNKLGVSLVHEKNWQNILDEINKAIKALPKSPATVEMSQASANLYAVKLAWRNEVMHPKDTYTLEEADNLIRQVRLFMQQLAKIV